MDIYGKETNIPNPIAFSTSDEMILVVGENSPMTAKEFLVQNVAIQYNQALNRIYEIGTKNTYIAPGRTIGTLQIGRIVGHFDIRVVLGPEGKGVWNPNDTSDPKSKIIKFYHKIDHSPAFKVIGAAVESYGFQNNAQGMLVYENVSIQFTSLEFEFEFQDNLGQIGIFKTQDLPKWKERLFSTTGWYTFGWTSEENPTAPTVEKTNIYPKQNF